MTLHYFPDETLKPEQDLDTYFAQAPGIWGLHGTAFGEGSTLVWDKRRLAELHAHKCDHAFSREHNELERIDANMRELLRVHPAAWHDARVVFLPRQWAPDGDEKTAKAVRRQGERRFGNLVGLMLQTTRLHRLLEISAKPAPEPTPLALLALVQKRALDTDESRRKAFFDPMREEAETFLQSAVSAYDAIRVASFKRASAAKRARLDQILSEDRRLLG